MKQEIKERVERIRKGEVPEGYRKTKVGIIPDDWDVEKFSNISTICRGASPRPITDKKWFDENSDIGWVRISDISKTKKYLFKTQQHLSELGIKKSRFVEKNNIIMSICATVGKPKFTGINVCIHDGFVVFEKPKINKRFLFYFLENIEDSWQRYGQTGSQMNLNTTIVGNELICIPLKSIEQAQIAEILSTWDKAIELNEKLIEEKKEFKKGLIQNLLVGKVRFKEYVENSNLHDVKRYSILPEEWGVKKASSIFSNISKKNNYSEQLLSATQNNGVIPRDMLDGDVMSPSGDTKSYKLVEEGDFVISLRSFQGGIEYSCYQGIISPAYTVLKNKIPVCKDFYRHLFKSRLFIDRLASSVIGIRDGKQISYDDFSFMLLPYPELKEQEKIASMLNSIDNEIDLLNTELNQLKEQKRGLMQLLLTGSVRVEVD